MPELVLICALATERGVTYKGILGYMDPEEKDLQVYNLSKFSTLPDDLQLEKVHCGASKPRPVTLGNLRRSIFQKKGRVLPVMGSLLNKDYNSSEPEWVGHKEIDVLRMKFGLSEKSFYVTWLSVKELPVSKGFPYAGTKEVRYYLAAAPPLDLEKIVSNCRIILEPPVKEGGAWEPVRARITLGRKTRQFRQDRDHTWEEVA